MTAVVFPPASFDAVVAFYSLTHVPRDDVPPPLGRIREWLRPSGVLIATMGVEDDPGGIEHDWLGVDMYFSHFSATEPAARRGGGLRCRLGRGPDGARGPLRGPLPVGRGARVVSDRRSLVAWTALVVVGLLVVAGASVLEPHGQDAPVGLVLVATIVFVVLLVVAGLLIFSRGLSLIAESRQDGATGSGTPDIRGLIRGVRLTFLSVATFVAAFGFLTGEAIFVVVAAVVAIVDIVETAIFLVVARASDRDDSSGS